MSKQEQEPKAKVMVFIPTYKCPAEISRVLGRLCEVDSVLIDHILIVDNQSPDNTLEVASESALRLNIPVTLMRNDDNYGLGGSHKHAFSWGKQNGFDFLIVLHGDDQADIRDIVPFLESGEAFDYDCFLGSRFSAGATREGYSWFRTFGNRVYNLLFSVVNFYWITDLGSGLNLYRLSSIELNEIKRFPDNLTFNYVMLMYSIWKRHRIKFFPISWREEGQASNVRLMRQAGRVLYLVLSRGFSFGGAFFRQEFREEKHNEYTGQKINHDES